jgi:aldose 1-epimerase
VPTSDAGPAVTVELHAGMGRVVIAPAIGGSIAAFECAGRAVLRRTPEHAIVEGDVRSFSCFPLVPFSNRIEAATLHWSGRGYTLTRYIDGEPGAIHGNGWQRPWTVQQQDATRLTIELMHDAAGRRAHEWPFPYRARQCFELTSDAWGVKLTLELLIENTGREAFPFGLGWHPYFDRDPDTEAGMIASGVWHTDPSHLPTRLGPVPADWSFDPPRAIGSTVLDNCLAGWQPPAIVRWPTRGLRAEIGADAACRFLVAYIPEAKTCFALEPVTHMTDAFHRAADDRDTGTRVLAPGASFSCTMSISASLDR